MKTAFAVLSAIVALVAVIVLGAGFGAYFTMIAVNYLFTPAVILALFGTAKLGFFQAFVLNFIAGMLFKSTSVNTGKS